MISHLLVASLLATSIACNGAPTPRPRRPEVRTRPEVGTRPRTPPLPAPKGPDVSRGATLPLVLLGDRGTWGLTGGGAAPKAAAPEALALLALVDVLEPGTEGDRTAVAAACGAQLDTSFGQARGPPSC